MSELTAKQLDSLETGQLLGNFILLFSESQLNSIKNNVNKTNERLGETNLHLGEASKNLTQLNVTASDLVTIAGRQVEVSERMSAAMARIDAQVSEELKVSKSSLEEQKKQTRLQELQFEFEQAKEIRDEARHEQAELKKKRLRAVKDSIYQLNRQTRLIGEGSYTTLERYFLASRLAPAIGLILPDDFDEIADKEYRDETEALMQRIIDSSEAALSQQDKEDLQRLYELQTVDEDDVAESLLAKCKIRRTESKILAEVRKFLLKNELVDTGTKDRIIRDLKKAMPSKGGA